MCGKAGQTIDLRLIILSSGMRLEATLFLSLITLIKPVGSFLHPQAFFLSYFYFLSVSLVFLPTSSLLYTQHPQSLSLCSFIFSSWTVLHLFSFSQTNTEIILILDPS